MLPLILLSMLGVLFYFTIVVIHMLIVIKIIPFQFVNGGRSATYDEQKKISTISLFIGLIGIIFMAYLSFQFISILNYVGLVIFSLLSLYWFAGLIMQFLGTKLERYIMSVIVLFGLYIHVMFLIQIIQSL